MVHRSAIKLKHGMDPDSMFDKTQLRMGIKVETEHTSERSVAKQIAKAHLTEIPNYYTYLRRMEKCAKEGH